MSKKASHEEYEMSYPPSQDLKLKEWRRHLASLSPSDFSIRKATTTAADARRMKDLQLACEPITVQSVQDNASTISTHTVLLAEIDGTHIGFCISSPGPRESDPLFVQVVGVVSEAQQRGVALALLHAAAGREPHRDIALATQDDNTAARTLNKRFAHSIGATIQRTSLRTYRKRDLGIRPGDGYRAWTIHRQQSIQN